MKYRRLVLCGLLGLTACGSDGATNTANAPSADAGSDRSSIDGAQDGDAAVFLDQASEAIPADATTDPSTVDQTSQDTAHESATDALTKEASADALSDVVLDVSPDTPTGRHFYVSPTGNDSSDGQSPATAWANLAKVQGHSFLPGDTILFARGGTWRGQLVAGSSGTASAPIVFAAYGSGSAPLFSGLTDIRGQASDWTQAGTNRWRRSLPKQTYIVVINGEMKKLASAVSGLTADTPWFWDQGTLTVFATSNPATGFSTVECGQDSSTISTGKQSHIVLRDLAATGGQLLDTSQSAGGCVYVDETSHHIEIRGLTVWNCHGGGIRVHGASNVNVEDNTVSNVDSHASGSSGDGIWVSWFDKGVVRPKDIVIRGNRIQKRIDRQGIAVVDGERVLIEGNTVEDGRSGIDLEPNDSTLQYVLQARILNNTIRKTRSNLDPGSSGIAVSGELSYGVQIEGNTIDVMDSTESIGITLSDYGVLLASAPGDVALIKSNTIRNAIVGMRVSQHRAGTKVRVSRNFIHTTNATAEYGFFIKFGADAVIENNLVSGPFVDGIQVTRTDNLEAKAELFHNDFRGYGARGLYARYAATVVMKNNLWSSQAAGVQHVNVSADATYLADGNLYDSRAGSFRWKGSTLTFANYRSQSGQDPAGLWVNPSFVSDTAAFDQAAHFKLLAGSPAIDAGVVTPLTTDYFGLARTGAGDIGAIEYAAQ